MPVVKHSRRLGLCGNLFVNGGSEELRQIARDYLDSPEKREGDRRYEERISGTASIMHQMVGYEK
jgi:hypothetical protein